MGLSYSGTCSGNDENSMNLTQSKDGKKEVVSNNENVCVDRHDFNDDLSLSSNSDVRSSERKVFPLQGKNLTNEHVRDKLIEEESNLEQPAPGTAVLA